MKTDWNFIQEGQKKLSQIATLIAWNVLVKGITIVLAAGLDDF